MRTPTSEEVANFYKTQSAPTTEEIAIFYKVRHFFNTNDAKGQLEFYLDWLRTEASKDKTVEDLMKLFDLDKLAERFEHCQSADSAENDTWQYVIDEYIFDNNIII